MTQITTNQETNQQIKESVESLVRVIELSQQHFSITLIHCNYEFLQQKIMWRFQNCSPFDVRVIMLDHTTIKLHDEIRKQLNGCTPQAVIISGLDQINDLEQLLSSSNYIREEFRNSFSFPILIWVTDIEMNKLIQLAPDLESWTTTLHVEPIVDELVHVIEMHTHHVHRKVLDIGAHGFVPESLVLAHNQCFEVTLAFYELKERHVLLSDELDARVKFVLGLEAYASNHMEAAYDYFEQSIKFWQGHHRLKHQACVLYYLGLWWRRDAVLRKSSTDQYDKSCENAEVNFRHCIDALEQAQRPDLVAKFINALGEVLHRREKWSELEEVAQTAIQLHQIYADDVRLAFAYGLLAEAKTESEPINWAEIKQLADQAITILDRFESSLNEDDFRSEDRFLRERQNHRGWYSLILAISLKNLGALKDATKQLDKLQKSSSQLSYHLQIKILKALQEIYLETKNYPKAFQMKRKRYSLQQQYGLRAFVGAGYLESCKSIECTPANSFTLPDPRSTLALEIQASGRDQDVENLVQRIQSPRYKLINLYGPSGVGKSSLINAGLVPRLEQKQSISGKRILSPIPVLRKYNEGRWLRDLVKSLTTSVEKSLDKSLPKIINLLDSASSVEDLVTILDGIRELNFMIVLVFDQFEEFFFASEAKSDRAILYQFLDQILANASVKIVISIREDHLNQLLDCSRTVNLKAIGGDILSRDFLYFLGNLSIRNAKSLIHALATRTQELEPELLETLIDDLASKSKEVSPIELQLVGAQLEEEPSQYQKLNGLKPEERIRKLVQGWLRRVIEDCGIENEDTAWKILYNLTHQEKIRTMKTRNELMAVSSETNNKRRKKQIKCILEVLEGSGVISKLRGDSKDFYQLVHDYLLSYIQEEYATHFDKMAQIVRELRHDLNQDDLNQDDLILRLNAVIKLGKLGSPQAAKLLKSYLLSKKNIEVSLRWHIFKALAQMKDDEALDLLARRGLEDVEPSIQAYTAHLLGQLKQVSAAEKLLAKCEDNHRSVRMQARWAAKQLGLEPPIPEEKSNPLLAFILIKTSMPTSENDDFSRVNHLRSLRLRDTCGVIECGITYGNYDLLVKVLAENVEALNEIVMGMMPHLNYVKLTRTFIVVNEPRLYYWRRPPIPQSNQANKYISYVWLETLGLSSDSLISCLMDIPEVSEAATVYGGFDVIAKIETTDPNSRDVILTQKIARLPFVESTVTYPIMVNNHSYWDNSENFNIPAEWLIEYTGFHKRLLPEKPHSGVRVVPECH
jgi:DNA-binding Lrp family transcriptional regulator